MILFCKTSSLIKLSVCYCFITIAIFTSGQIKAQNIKDTSLKKLTHHMSPEEKKLKHLIGKDFASTAPPTGPIRNVAEFDKMQGVLIRYPYGISYTIIAEMAEDINVVTIVSNQMQQTTVLNNYLSNGVNTDNCSFLIAPSESYWTRDYGPWYIFDGNDEPGIVNFPYNRPSRPDDDNIPVEMSAYLGINLFGMNVITAGGNYMTDGMGISSSSDLVWDENPDLTATQIDQYFEDFLGIGNYHVLDDPNNTYIDHIDCWGKFLSINKVLIREVPETHAQYDEIEATAAYYAAQTSSYGTPFEVYRVYTPNDQPYTNSLILNNKVLLPITGSSWDDDAILAYENAMPGYEIIGLTGSWESTDALHCRTKGIADIGMLYIKHIPFLGYQPVQSKYTIEAEITAHSGQAIYSDSAFIIYSINNSDWDTILMTNTSGKMYSGNIPEQSYGGHVEYYLFAADQSGRNATQPFIGELDPFGFYTGQPSAPDLVVNPSNIEVTLSVDEVSVQHLTLENQGQLSLEYDISKQYVSKNSKAYCTSSGGGNNEFIENVSIGSIDNTTAQSYYADYTNSSTVVNVGESYPITITNGAPQWSLDQCGIWVDWNQNEDFTDDEPISVSGTPGVGPYTATIVPPTDALQGSARMRVQIIYDQSPDPCNATFSYGEVEDYTLEVNNNFVDWLSLNPLTGTISVEDNMQINVSLNTIGLEEGNYNANISIISNDPDQPVIIVPVHLLVSGTRYIDLKVLLEGAFDGSGMNTTLSGINEFPLTQPYSVFPWNYYGTENISSISQNVVDWILVEYRDAMDASAALSSTEIGKQALLLLNDGNIVDVDGTSNPEFNYSITNQLFTIIHHRNHLSVMSANPLEISGNTYSYDFTVGLTQAYGTDALSELPTGIWGMIAGDFNIDGQINDVDKTNAWNIQTGLKGYQSSDSNLDGEVNNIDKNEYWLPNQGKGSQIP